MKKQLISTNFIKTNLCKIAQITSSPKSKGVTRLGYTKEENHAFEFVRKLMESCKLKTETDSYGNLYGCVGPSDAKQIIICSHLDSVPFGGMFDGVTGVVAAIEAVRYILALKYPLKNEIVIMATSSLTN